MRWAQSAGHWVNWGMGAGGGEWFDSETTADSSRGTDFHFDSTDVDGWLKPLIWAAQE